MEPKFKKPRPITKLPVGLKLSALGVKLLDRLSERHRGTPLHEHRGPLVDRLLLHEARAVRGQDVEVERILSEAGL